MSLLSQHVDGDRQVRWVRYFGSIFLANKDNFAYCYSQAHAGYGAMFDLENVSKRYDHVQALRSLNLSIPAGKTTVLIGPSGCGKSTLLRLMAGLIPNDEGLVTFKGAPLTKKNIKVLRRKMGFVVQEGGLFPHMSAENNICLMARQTGWEEGRIQRRIKQLLQYTRFPQDALNRYPAQLSSGQRQRVSLMRALMLDPDVLLLDEPLGALDPLIRFELQTDLKSIFDALRKTVVLVTHDIGEAGYFGDLIVLMQDGGIVQQGNLADLVTRPASRFVENFVNAQRTLLAL